jgi:hypothetical protein
MEHGFQFFEMFLAFIFLKQPETLSLCSNIWNDVLIQSLCEVFGPWMIRRMVLLMSLVIHASSELLNTEKFNIDTAMLALQYDMYESTLCLAF